ncbi:hypothetical protein [Neptuniibacter sp.]|uniref:hypothetical protein n=1 Tax=Neptuniibacter sp. TaxID=1962643 RepID=UPI003B591092
MGREELLCVELESNQLINDKLVIDTKEFVESLKGTLYHTRLRVHLEAHGYSSDFISDHILRAFFTRHMVLFRSIESTRNDIKLHVMGKLAS